MVAVLGAVVTIISSIVSTKTKPYLKTLFVLFTGFFLFNFYITMKPDTFIAEAVNNMGTLVKGINPDLKSFAWGSTIGTWLEREYDAGEYGIWNGLDVLTMIFEIGILMALFIIGVNFVLSKIGVY